MDKNYFRGLLVGFALAFVAATFFSWIMVRNAFSERVSKDTYEANEKTQTIINLIDENFIGEYELNEVYENSYRGLISALGDKYAAYYSAEDYKKAEQALTGQYVGMGALVGSSQDSDYPFIVKVNLGGSAEEAGLLDGDVITKIDDISVKGMNLDDVVALIKGEEGTKFKITIERGVNKEIKVFDITRKKVDTITVASEMLDNNIGHIVVSAFEMGTYKQFEYEYDNLLKEGMTSLIIDLRSNPGGLLSTAVDMCDRILPKDKLVVYAINKSGKKEEYYTKGDDTIDMPIVILLNKNSASASEVFTGCLKDYNKATIIGEKSFGKGIVQTQYALKDGSKVKLTTAYYYSPNGTNIHGVGISPDIEVTNDTETPEDEVLIKAIEYLSK